MPALCRHRWPIEAGEHESLVRASGYRWRDHDTDEVRRKPAGVADLNRGQKACQVCTEFAVGQTFTVAGWESTELPGLEWRV
jgi:hypothetical protein